MAAIMTNRTGTLAYWENGHVSGLPKAFEASGTFNNAMACSFARLSVFAANGNHAPNSVESAVCWDAGMALLFRIARQS